MNHQDEVRMSFGEYVQQRRKMLDLTQEELARRASCTVFAVRKIEAGERRPSKQLAGWLASALKISPEDQPTFVRVARGELGVSRLNSIASSGAVEPARGPAAKAIPVHLPGALTPFLGREKELSALARLFEMPQCRLITITGPGGIGKTRLAIEAASCQKHASADGVFFVALAPLGSTAFLFQTIGEALGVTFSDRVELETQLTDYLQGKQVLLVLDNAEHLLDGIEVIVRLLERAPGVKILVTSREKLSLLCEWVYEIQGLPVPANGLEQVETYASVALFAQSARRVHHAFKLQAQDLPWVIQICQLVEGLPLGIELAAAWTHLFSCQAIAKEIERNLDFLSVSFRDLPPRHRSLRATLDHSWNLLNEQERSALSQLAVFQCGFLRQEAEAVCRARPEVLSSLQNKSLLRVDGQYYVLHELVQQYAALRLAEQDQVARQTQNRFIQYFLSLAEQAEGELHQGDQQAWHKRLKVELCDLRAAMTLSMESEQVEYALRMATALWRFWWTQGYWREGLEWLEKGLSGAKTVPTPDEVRAKALNRAAWMKRELGDYMRSISMFEESLDIWRRLEDQAGIALTLSNLGATVIRRGDYARAITLLEEALLLRNELNDLRGVRVTLMNLGLAEFEQGHLESAIRLFSEALERARTAGDENSIGLCLTNLGEACVKKGDRQRAETCFAEAETIYQRLDNRAGMADILRIRAFIALGQGNLVKACHLLTESILILKELGDKEITILGIEGLAAVAGSQRDFERSARLLSASETQRKAIGMARSPLDQGEYDQCLTYVQKNMNARELSAAWAQGSHLTFDQVVSYALHPCV